jgi:hypothetical protein
MGLLTLHEGVASELGEVGLAGLKPYLHSPTRAGLLRCVRLIAQRQGRSLNTTIYVYIGYSYMRNRLEVTRLWYPASPESNGRLIDFSLPNHMAIDHRWQPRGLQHLADPRAEPARGVSRAASVPGEGAHAGAHCRAAGDHQTAAHLPRRTATRGTSATPFSHITKQKGRHLTQG